MAEQGHGLHVEFYIDSIKQEFKSEEAGRPIHADREFVRIHIPGDRNYSVEREASDGDRNRFALEYARFKNGLKDQEQAVGTPLIQWPAMSRAMAKDFSSVNVHTVEQLASLSDTSIQSFGLGGREWVTKAKAFLEVSGNSAAAQKYAAENEELKQRIAQLEAQFAELAPDKPKLGRPRKPENAVSELTEAL
jgi:hypothetical protein